MHPYIPYLLEDIKNAERLPEETPETDRPQTLEEELEAIENWVSGEGSGHSFGYYCGLEKKDFPPEDQLSEEDIIKIFRAFEHLLFSWNADIDLPEDLPWKLCYKFMVGILKEEFSPINSGSFVFDFCTGYAPDCVFGKYCSCRDYWEEDEGQ